MGLQGTGDGMGWDVLRDSGLRDAGAFLGQVWLTQVCLYQVVRIQDEGFCCLFVCFKCPAVVLA